MKNCHSRYGLLLLALSIVEIIASSGICQAAARSEWVYLDSTGKLAYRSLPTGDHIMDFSYAGYGGGGVAIPDVEAKTTLRPGGDDDAAVIQKAIDEVSEMPLIDGHRGAVELTAGTFECARPLTIAASGVVLRGNEGTILRLTGTPHLAIGVKGKEAISADGRPATITDNYIPSGTNVFHVESATGFKAGDTIQITRPVTTAWVGFMGMGSMVRNSKDEHWLSGKLETTRVIREISGDRITVDVPLSDNYDARYLNPPGSTVVKVKISGAVSQVGIEHLRIVSPPQAIAITDPQFKAISFDDGVDCWARDLEIVDTIDSMHIGAGSSRVTIQRVNITHTVATKGAAKPGDFGDNGTQALFDRCSGRGDNLFYFATFGRTQGPNVVLNCKFEGNGHIQPHMRWSTGLLVDSCQVPASGIDLMNRGIMGSGHGWTMGWGVAWNCVAKTFLIQQPPGSMNWAIGCRGAAETEAMPGGNGPKLPNGIYDSQNAPVTPASLYLEQLRERLGVAALKNVGY